MRPLICLAHALVGLALTLQGCVKADRPAGDRVAAGPRVGQPAPAIDGEDVDGVGFKLIDYRGKVVLLDFWGHW